MSGVREKVRAARYPLAVGASLIAGMLVALQSRINGELGVALNSGALAALVSFSVGLSVMTLVVLVNPAGRQGLADLRGALARRELPWWAMLGGVAGSFLVLTQGLTAGVLGVALFSIAVVTGQSLGALVIDSRGWFGVLRVALVPRRAIGAVVVVLGVFVALDVGPGAASTANVLFTLPLIAGIGTGFQQAVNGRVKSAAGSALSATVVNFATGTATLVVVVLVSWVTVGFGPAGEMSWWLWTGGAVGTILVAIQVTTVGIIGVLGLGVSVITGQLVGSILLEGLWPVAASNLGVATVIGAIVTLVGAVLVTVGKRTAARD